MPLLNGEKNIGRRDNMLLNISYKDYTTNEGVRGKFQADIVEYDEPLTELR